MQLLPTCALINLRLFLESDGIIFGGSNIVLEGGAIQACMKWCSEAHKPSYVVGPLFLEQDQVAAIRYRSRDPSEEGAKVQRFLDKIYESHGKKSLIYVSAAHHAPPNVFTYIYSPRW